MKQTLRWFLVLALAATTATAQEFLSKGKVALSARDTAGAIQNFTAAVKAGQKVGEADYYLGAIAVAQKRIDDAQRYLEESTKYDDDNVDALFLLAKVYVGKKNTAAAFPVYRKAQKLAPKNAVIATQYGILLLSVDSVDAAIVQLTRAKDLDGQNPDVYAALGQAYLKQNVPPLAVTNYQKAIGLAPKEFVYRDSLASIFLKMKNYPEAVAQYDSIALLDTTNVEPLLDIGRILSRAVGSSRGLGNQAAGALRAKKAEIGRGVDAIDKGLLSARVLRFGCSRGAAGNRARPQES